MCNCGEKIRYGEIPCKDEWLCISDQAFDKMSGTIDSEVLYKQMTSILKCAVCGRLWIFWDGFDRPPKAYIIEQSPSGTQDGRL